MRIQIDIRTAGAAFCDVDGGPDEYARAAEVARLMGEVTASVAGGATGGRLIDTCGNLVGVFAVTEEG